MKASIQSFSILNVIYFLLTLDKYFLSCNKLIIVVEINKIEYIHDKYVGGKKLITGLTRYL